MSARYLQLHIDSQLAGRYNASLLLAHKIAQYFDSTIEDVFLFDNEEQWQTTKPFY